MTRIREPVLEAPLASRQDFCEPAECVTGPRPNAIGLADCLRALAAGADTRTSGMAEAVTALFNGVLRFDAADPHWPDRDRLLVPAGGGTEAVVAAALRLTDHAGLGTIDLRDHPAAQSIPGPPGQTLGVAVGMALAERLLASRFGRSLVDHRTWVLATTGELAGGISHEAAVLAGHLQLDRLAVLWDDDETELPSGSTDQLKRFAASGWTTRRVNGRDPAELAAALALAVRSRKPTFIACSARSGLRGQSDSALTAPDQLLALWQAAGNSGAAARRGWRKRTARHALRPEFERVTAGRLPDGWTGALAVWNSAAEPGSTVDAHRRLAWVLAQAVPELVGVAAGNIAGLAAVAAGRFGGQAVTHGVCPHGIAACTAGLALHGGVVPFAEADLAHSDALRPALRLLADTRHRAVHILTDDGTQPEQLAALCTVAGLHLHRPADAAETAECWELALRRTDGPSVLVLSGQDAPTWRTDTGENRCARGGYVLAEADGPREATLIASGPEVAVAMAARAELAAAGVAVAVVSLPCRELFAQLAPDEIAQVLGNVLRAAVTPWHAPAPSAPAWHAPGWDRWLGPDGIVVAGPANMLAAGAVASAVRKRLPIQEEKAL